MVAAIDAVRNSAGYTYFRAFTNDLNLRNTHSWLDYQVKVDTVEDYVNALKNPDVDNVVFEGQNAATMPTFYYKDGDWHVDFGGVTEQQRELANAIEAEGLGLEYAMKSPIERTTENADYVSNRNAGSRAMWSAKAEEEQSALPIQYSLAEDEKSVHDKKDLARFYAAIGEMKAGKKAQFQKNADGLYMLAIGNKIVYTNGQWSNPSIEKVDVIGKKTESEMWPIRDTIFTVEQMEDLNAEEKRRILTKVLGDEAPQRYGDGLRTSNAGDGNGRGDGGIGNEVYSGAGSDGKPQYSVRFTEDDQLDALISFARDNNAADLLQDLYGKKLSILFGGRDTRTSFEQVNPVRILKTLAANLGTQIYTADIKDDVIMGYYDQAARAIVVDENNLANLRVGLFGIGQYVYDAMAINSS